MDATFFIEGVLRPHLLPFIESVYPDGHRFMQNIIYYIILLYNNNYLIYYLIYYIIYIIYYKTFRMVEFIIVEFIIKHLEW